MHNLWRQQDEWNARDLKNIVDKVFIGSVFLASWIFTAIFLFVWATMDFSKIIVGTLYLHDCPGQPMLPIYLIVSGGVGIAISYMCNQQMHSQNEHISAWFQFACFFGNCWLIVGHVWIFVFPTPSLIPGDPQYCDRALYLFAVCVVVLTFVVFLLVALSFCLQVCGFLTFRRAVFVQNRQRVQQGHRRGPA